MSIVDQMGQSILAKAKKQREKEERNQLIGAAGNLATSIINQRLQDSANKFLESEEFLQARARVLIILGKLIKRPMKNLCHMKMDN